MADERTPELRVVQELGEWAVTLTSGEIVEIHAHAYSEEGGFYAFSVLMEGTPAFYVDVVRIPAQLVESVRGG